MRKLSAITASIVPPPIGQRSFARRRVRAVYDSLTCMCLVRHGESPTEIFVSDDGDVTSAIWLHRAPVLVDPKQRGKFLVVTLSRTLAQQKGLALSIIDRSRFLPEERADLEDAVEAARRTRERMFGRSQNRPTWSGGRNVYA